MAHEYEFERKSAGLASDPKTKIKLNLKMLNLSLWSLVIGPHTCNVQAKPDHCCQTDLSVL